MNEQKYGICQRCGRRIILRHGQPEYGPVCARKIAAQAVRDDLIWPAGVEA